MTIRRAGVESGAFLFSQFTTSQYCAAFSVLVLQPLSLNRASTPYTLRPRLGSREREARARVAGRAAERPEGRQPGGLAYIFDSAGDPSQSPCRVYVECSIALQPPAASAAVRGP